jgi:2,3-bisphosphoglycerate-dependent phosphoglycerate mutase
VRGSRALVEAEVLPMSRIAREDRSMGKRTLVLLRHGRSRADDEGVHEGRYNSPLTEVGRDQARRLARRWEDTDVRFDRVVCSSLVRARETAEIVGTALGVTVEVSDLWMERDNGPLAGLTEDEADARFPPPPFRSRWAPLTTSGGESIEALHRRASEALEALLRGPGERLLIVAHGGVLNAAMRVLLGAGRDSHFHFSDNGLAELVLDEESEVVRLVSLRPSPVDPTG